MEARVPGDGSEQISYVELASMVREGLGLSLKELPERKLMAIWLALDEDNSGLISAGELGAFLRGGTGAVLTLTLTLTLTVTVTVTVTLTLTLTLTKRSPRRPEARRRRSSRSSTFDRRARAPSARRRPPARAQA